MELEYRPRCKLNRVIQLLPLRLAFFLAHNSVPEFLCSVSYRPAAHFKVCLQCACGVSSYQKIHKNTRNRKALLLTLCIFGFFGLQYFLQSLSRSNYRFPAVASIHRNVNYRKPPRTVCFNGLRCGSHQLFLLLRNGCFLCDLLDCAHGIGLLLINLRQSRRIFRRSGHRSCYVCVFAFTFGGGNRLEYKTR